MIYEVQPNPWNMSPSECAAMDALIKGGCEKAAASELGLSLKTVSSHVYRAKLRMQARTRLLALIEWDRWARAQK